MEVSLASVAGSGSATVAAALRDGAALALVGMAIVFAALILLWLTVEALCRVLAARPRRPTDSPALTSVGGTRTSPAPMPDAVDQRTLVVIAAAVAAVVGPGARVRRVRRLHRSPTSIWTEHGRVVVQSSHRGQR